MKRLLLLLGVSAQAQVEEQVQYRYYDVTADAGESLRQAVNQA